MIVPKINKDGNKEYTFSEPFPRVHVFDAVNIKKYTIHKNHKNTGVDVHEIHFTGQDKKCFLGMVREGRCRRMKVYNVGLEAVVDENSMVIIPYPEKYNQN